jgi:predicted CoA-binding protein
MKKTLVIGASAKPERYANMAMHRLQEKDHTVILFNPSGGEIEGLPVYAALSEIPGPVDTVTLYTGPRHLEPMVPDILALKPRRIIANPGTETPAMKEAAEKAGIEYREACTLVMLSTGQF